MNLQIHTTELIGGRGLGIFTGIRTGSFQRNQCIPVKKQIIGTVVRPSFMYNTDPVNTIGLSG